MAYFQSAHKAFSLGISLLMLTEEHLQKRFQNVCGMTPFATSGTNRSYKSAQRVLSEVANFGTLSK